MFNIIKNGQITFQSHCGILYPHNWYVRFFYLAHIFILARKVGVSWYFIMELFLLLLLFHFVLSAFLLTKENEHILYIYCLS